MTIPRAVQVDGDRYNAHHLGDHHQSQRGTWLAFRGGLLVAEFKAPATAAKATIADRIRGALSAEAAAS